MTQRIPAVTDARMTGLSEGTPPLLGVCILGGRHLVKWLPVYDGELFERLRQQVNSGDIIRISTLTELRESEGRLITYLTDFSMPLPGVDSAEQDDGSH